MEMPLSNISKTDLFLSNNEMTAFPKQTKMKYPHHIKHMTGLKLQSAQLLQPAVSSSRSSQIGLFRYFSDYKTVSPCWENN